MTVDLDLRLHRERQATMLFLGTSLISALVIAAMLVSGWGGGRLDDRVEVLFWAGAILAGVGVLLFGVAAIPRGSDDVRATRAITNLVRAGLILFVVGPVLSIVADFADYWI